MRTKEITVYSFSELADEVKSEVLDSFRDINTDFMWYDFLFDFWQEELEKFGFYRPKIYFSGFGSQGDGACFESQIDLEKAFECYIAETGIPKHLKSLQGFIAAECYAAIVVTNPHYLHWNTRSIEHSSSHEGKHLNAFFEKFMKWLEEKRISFCQRIYRELETEYEHLTSDDAVKETIEANDYEFTATGKVA